MSAVLSTSEKELVIRSPEVFREKFGIDARTGQAVLALDLNGQRVLARRLADGMEQWVAYDQLLIATGPCLVSDLPGG